MKISDYSFTKADYEQLTYNVMEVDYSVNLLERFHGLNTIRQLHVEIAPNRVDYSKCLRYIILVYDPKSPLRSIIKDEDRKMYALLMAGVDYNASSGLFPFHWDKIMRCQNKIVNEMILGFVVHFNAPKYTQMVIGYEMFNEQMLMVLNPETADEGSKKSKSELAIIKQTLWTSLSARRKDIDKLAEEILTEKNPFLKEDLFSMANAEIEKKFNISAEERVKNRIEKGSKKIWP